MLLQLKNTITVFSITTCPHCLKAKSTLASLKAPFTEINIETHPNRRSDMIALSSRMSVPQVFFGNRHLGGNDDFQKLLSSIPSGASDELVQGWFDSEIVEGELDSRLLPSTDPPVVVQPLPEINDKNTMLNEKRGGSYIALNDELVWTGSDNVDPVQLTHSLKKMVDGVCSDHRTDMGVDYAEAKKSERFETFKKSTAMLQACEMSSMDNEVKTAFLVNLYNILIKHAFIQVGIPFTEGTNPTGGQGKIMGGFFDGVGYVLGSSQQFFSFDGLENGLLRGNRSNIYKSGDDRLQLALSDKDVDRRIHFALNCGASSCPPIKKFTGEAIREELDIVSASYCESDGNVLVGEGFLQLNTIFKWYRVDFGETDVQVASAIVDYLRGDKKRKLEQLLESVPADGEFIKYFPYDWKSDSILPVIEFVGL